MSEKCPYCSFSLHPHGEWLRCPAGCCMVHPATFDRVRADKKTPTTLGAAQVAVSRVIASIDVIQNLVESGLLLEDIRDSICEFADRQLDEYWVRELPGDGEVLEIEEPW